MSAQAMNDVPAPHDPSLTAAATITRTGTHTSTGNEAGTGRARTNANHDATSRREKIRSASIHFLREACRTRGRLRAVVTISGTMVIADRTLEKKRVCQFVQ